MADESGDPDSDCPKPENIQYNSSLGILLAVPDWEAALTALTLSLIIILTIVGNILVILSVFTYKPLRIVQNFFIVSLAVADLTVAILVLPLNVAYSILGRWEFGIHVCKMWLTSDVLCCTASILNLCCIALDRFWAITDPIDYAQKRTLKRVMLMIGGVWILSLVISSPPLIGWNNWPDHFDSDTPCKLSSRKGYVIYSSLGSFFIPLLIMTIVYVEIFIATRRRLRERAKASNLIAKNRSCTVAQNDKMQRDEDSVSSEANHNEQPHDGKTSHKRKKKKLKKPFKKETDKEKIKFLSPLMVQEDSVTDNPDNSSGSNRKNSDHCDSTITNLNEIQPTSTTAISQAVPDISIRKPSHDVSVVVSSVKKPGVVYQFIEEKQRISLSKERRAARTLGIIMGVFVVCWLPFFLMYVILPFCPNCCLTNKYFINFITWLGYVNSALNPIIYTIFNMDFRRAFKKLLGIKV